MIPEPSAPLWTAVKARYDSWPPDNEDNARELGLVLRGLGDTATDGGGQLTDKATVVREHWRDEAGGVMGEKIAANGDDWARAGSYAQRLAGVAEQYSTQLTAVKRLIVEVIAANEEQYDKLQFRNRVLAARLAAGIADYLRSLVGGEATSETGDGLSLQGLVSELFRHHESKGETSVSGHGWTANGKASAESMTAGTTRLGAANGKFSQYNGYADQWRVSAEGKLSNDDGSITLSGKALAEQGAGFTSDSGIVHEDGETAAQAGAGAWVGDRATVRERADIGLLGYEQQASGLAGAEATVGAKVGTDGAEVNTEVFAGAKGSVREAVDVGGVGVGATAEGMAGVGYTAKATFGEGDDDKFHIGGKLGGSVGLGGSVAFDLQVDGSKVSKTASEVASVAGTAGRAVGNGVHRVLSVF
jgi:hypothetical protein